jgi:hypothetical protein
MYTKYFYQRQTEKLKFEVARKWKMKNKVPVFSKEKLNQKLAALL